MTLNKEGTRVIMLYAYYFQMVRWVNFLCAAVRWEIDRLRSIKPRCRKAGHDKIVLELRQDEASCLQTLQDVLWSGFKVLMPEND